MEETLTKMGFQVSRQIVRMVLSETRSPILARRFLNGPHYNRFKRSVSTYNLLTTILAHSKDFNTMQMVFSEKMDAQVDVTVRTFRFATAWHDDPNSLNEVIRIIEKMPLTSRVRSYNLLIRAVCRKNANAALRVLEKMVTDGCAPNRKPFRPFILFDRLQNQMDKLQEIYETMEIFGCPPVGFTCKPC